MSAAAGSSASLPPTPPPNNQTSNNASTSHCTQSPSPSGDGETLQTPTWTPALNYAPPTTSQTYIIVNTGNSPRYIRTTLSDARTWAHLGYAVYDGMTYLLVSELPLANQGMPERLVSTLVSPVEARQIGEIKEAEEVLARDPEEAGAEYNAAQGWHGDAFHGSEGGDDDNSSVGRESSEESSGEDADSKTS